MAELFSTGRIVDLIILLVVIEALVLFVYWRRAGRGIAFLDLLPNLLSGAFLLLAVKAAMLALAWPWIAAALLAALLAHLGDLVRRWR